MKFLQIDRIVAILGIATLTCLTAGCGGNPDTRPLVELRGMVTVDGDTVDQGSIQFRSSKTGESAYTNLTSDGYYTMTFPAADIGVEYTVSIGPPIIENQNALEMLENPVPETKSIIPEKYSSIETSGLKVKIEQAGRNDFDFELKSN